MHATQMQALVNACKDHDDVRIVTCALHIAATAARERKQDAAIAIRHLVDAHQRGDQVEKSYREQRLSIATKIMAGLVANPGDRSLVAGEAIRLADSLLFVNATAPVPPNAKTTGPGDDLPPRATVGDG